MSVKDNYPTIKPSLLLAFSDVKALDPRITYSRASTGTFYDGKTVAKAEENLLTYSQEFDNAVWVKTSSTVTANSVAAPDGTTTADTVNRVGTSNANVGQSGTRLAAAYVASVFAKAGTQDFLAIQINTNGTTRASFITFNLTSGAIGTEQTLTTNVGLTATATSVGGGWYRCSVAYTSLGGTDNFLINPASAADSRNGIDGGTIYIWGAQLEQRSSVTAYTPTTTQPITNYIPVLLTAQANVARFQHNPTTGESEGFWVEEQRANLVTYSEQFDNAAWAKLLATIQSNVAIGPDGTQTADKLIPDNASSGQVTGVEAMTASTTFTFSVFAKKAELGFVFLRVRGNDNVDTGAYFNLNTGVVGTVESGVTAAIQSVGSGWYRCSITKSSGSGATAPRQRIIPTNTDGNWDTGNGYSGVYIWGAQLEAGAFPTSYIKTEASQVTRSADSASMTRTNFSSWFSNAEGTLYAESSFAQVPSTLNPGLYAVTDGTANNAIQSFQSSGTSSIRSETIYSGTNQGAIVLQSSIAANTVYKTALAYKFNDIAGSGSGGAVVTDTSANIPAVSQINIAQSRGGDRLNGTIRKLAFYSRRLSNAELQALTS